MLGRVRSGARCGILATCLVASAAGAQSPSGNPSAVTTLSVYAYPEDNGASNVASKVQDIVTRRAAARGWRATVEPRIGDYLERSPDELVRASEALATARVAYNEGLQQNSLLRLEGAEEALARARAAFVDASAAPQYSELRSVHLYLAIVEQNLGQNSEALASFRTAVFLSPANATLNPQIFPPSVIENFNAVKKSIASGPKGSLRVETSVRGAEILLDGVSRGTTPKTLSDLPEGTHYLELRLPNASPVLQPVEIVSGIESPMMLALKSVPVTMKQVWNEAKGEAGAAAIARILQVDRVAIFSARTTVAGVSPYTVRGASFDGSSGHKMASGETTTLRDASGSEEKVGKLAEALLRAEPPSVAPAGDSQAAIYAARRRFVGEGTTLLMLETGVDYSTMIFDGKGHYVGAYNYDSTVDFDDSQAYDSYVETRTVLHFRYGMKPNVAMVIDAPFYTKQIRYDYLDGSGNIIKASRSDSGMGDVVAGVDVRLPRFEKGHRALVFVSTRVKMPTGSSVVPTDSFLRAYDTLVMGSGQWDIYLGMGGVLANGNRRLAVQAGWNARIGDTVAWYPQGGRPKSFVNPGDEQKVRVDGGYHLGRWLAPELYLDFTHRDATKKFVDPITHDNDKAREMYLLNGGLQLEAEFSEKTEAGIVLENPIWGRATMTFFPLDVTGTRLFGYYGYRF